jgi:Fur family zinc uptake transcriptional regulator
MLTLNTPNRRLPFETYVSHGTAAGIRWTGRREDVLRLIWSVEQPLGAYEVAERLGGHGASVVHPTSVYRCLRCLEAAGLVLPVVTWKKHVLSPDPQVRCWGLLLCRHCRSCMPVDLTAGRERLDRRLSARGFAPRTYSAESVGACLACSENGGSP